MPLTTVYQGQVQHLQILDEAGNLDAALAKDTLTPQDVRFLYEQMIVCREFDDAAFKLQRSGRMGTFPQNRGQEATSLGIARAMRKGVDFLVPYYRENGTAFLHGLPMHFILLHWMGDERGNAIPKNVAMTPLCVEIGAQTLHAAGIAWAYMLRKEDRAVVCTFGEGATSTGDFHEAMNFAATFKLPVIFCCINNGYAISVPVAGQTGSQTFAQKALAYGMPTLRVDGNDIFAVYKAHRDMLNDVRSGKGPGFIECLTYRLADHTTADDARRYRDDAELATAIARDPMTRTRKYLERINQWNDEAQAKAVASAKAVVSDVVRVAGAIEAPAVSDIFNYTFSQIPEQIRLQRDTMRTDSLGQDPAQIGLKAAAQQQSQRQQNGQKNPEPHAASI